jgi:uncharacterized protein (TIGR00375 family)
MIVNADLHIHGRYSIGSSKFMTFEPLSKEAVKKGVQMLATGDCLHSKWMDEIKKLDRIDEGTFEKNKVRFILTTEVEDNRRVHHLLIFPSIASAADFREKITPHSKNIDTDGRPNVALGGEDIAQYAADVDALIGPCHAFTPWTALYASHDSLKSCYKDMEDYVSYVELGLSADTNYGDRIAELERLTFLTNSDAHSTNPTRIAREFNRFEMKDATFSALKKAIERSGKRKPVLNVGLPPQEGKYNESACIRCFTHYTFREALMHKWKCTKCGARIKKGVKDRVNEIATYEAPKHPSHRPEYLHLIPLGDIITRAVGHSSPNTKKVTSIWNELVNRFGDEVKVLLDADFEDMAKMTDETVVDAVKAFRNGVIIIHPGGGGQYGTMEIPDDVDEAIARKGKSQSQERESQTSLFEF